MALWPVVRCLRWRSERQRRANAATRASKPTKPSATRSPCKGFVIRRDRAVSRALWRIDSLWRKCMRRMMFKSPVWITPSPPPRTALGKVRIAQFLVKITRQTGLGLGENQQSIASADQVLRSLAGLTASFRPQACGSQQLEPDGSTRRRMQKTPILRASARNWPPS